MRGLELEGGLDFTHQLASGQVLTTLAAVRKGTGLHGLGLGYSRRCNLLPYAGECHVVGKHDAVPSRRGKLAGAIPRDVVCDGKQARERGPKCQGAVKGREMAVAAQGGGIARPKGRYCAAQSNQRCSNHD